MARLILDTKADRIHQLNVSASFIWKCVEPDLSLRDIAWELIEAFDLDDDQAQRDVVHALERFKALNLIF